MGFLMKRSLFTPLPEPLSSLYDTCSENEHPKPAKTVSCILNLDH